MICHSCGHKERSEVVVHEDCFSSNVVNTPQPAQDCAERQCRCAKHLTGLRVSQAKLYHATLSTLKMSSCSVYEVLEKSSSAS